MSRLSDYNKANANIKKITPGDIPLSKGMSAKVHNSNYFLYSIRYSCSRPYRRLVLYFYASSQCRIENPYKIGNNVANKQRKKVSLHDAKIK